MILTQREEEGEEENLNSAIYVGALAKHPPAQPNPPRQPCQARLLTLLPPSNREVS